MKWTISILTIVFISLTGNAIYKLDALIGFPYVVFYLILPLIAAITLLGLILGVDTDGLDRQIDTARQDKES